MHPDDGKFKTETFIFLYKNVLHKMRMEYCTFSIFLPALLQTQ